MPDYVQPTVDVPALTALLDGKYAEIRQLVRKNLAEEDPRLLPKAIANQDSGMQLFDQHLAKLWKAELISGTEALRLATNPEALAMIMRGLSTRDLAASLVG